MEVTTQFCLFSHYSLLIKKNKKGIIVMVAYVYDIILKGGNEQKVATTNEYLRTNFVTKDFGHLQ